MRRRQVAIATILAAMIAACGTAPSAQRAATPAASLPPAEPPTAVPLTAPPAAEFTRVPTAAPPSPTPTPKPPPKRPTGMRIAQGILTLCGDTSDPEFTCDEYPAGYRVTWKTPRAKGSQVRVYGVTECLATDIYGAFIDGGWCLRQGRANDIAGTLGVDGQQYLDHTAIPDSWLVPLAKARASKGKVIFDYEDYQLGYFSDPEDPDHETALYAVVAAVYDADGQRSPFTVVYSSHYCNVIEDLECPDAYFSQMGYYQVR